MNLERVLIAAIAAATLLMFLGPKAIAWLRRNEVGQFVRPEGLIPDAHAQKQGTPTMGGVLILIAMSLPFLILSQRSTVGMLVFGTTLACGAIGFADDFMKFRQRRSGGLAGKWRMLLLLGLSVLFTVVAVRVGGLQTTLQLPVADRAIEIGPILFTIVVFLIISGFANAVNLTDGLDGLAAGTSGVVLLAYTGMAFVASQTLGTSIAGPQGRDLAIFSAAMVGACLGFLWFNSFPAAVFMGDTGSYALGGAIASMAIMTKTEILLIVIGGVFVIEALSVIVQVVVFKKWRRRVFLMTPIHHHFEMAAWSETKIIVRFWLIASLLAATGFTLYFRDLVS
jgi:phospho-N-acetylmuramoyl-pentapeptide-transferase